MIDLIDYIDNTNEEYFAGKFGTAKAWHVTNKLIMALVVKVGKTGDGALRSFEAADGISMAKVILDAVLKSLDTISKISALDYIYFPAVSVELVKLLPLTPQWKPSIR